MKKRLSALLCLILALLCRLSATAEGFASFYMPEGAAHKPATQISDFEIPAGLEPMYRLMQSDNPNRSVDLIRMKNGRALLSISTSLRAAPVATRDLLALWPRVAETIAGEVAYVSSDERCARLGERFGVETLEIDTSAVTSENVDLKLTLHCSAFCRDNELVEVWMVYPAQTAYLFDTEALAQRDSDVADAESVLNSLDFGTGRSAAPGVEKQETEPETTVYEDPLGRFTTAIPSGSLVLTKNSGEATFAQLRNELVAKYGEGANALCDANFADIFSEDATMIVLADQSAVAMLYRVNVPAFQTATVDDLMRTYKATEESLAKKFGDATCLRSGEKLTISGQEHAWMSYRLHSQEMYMLLNLMCCVDTAGWLRELDVFLLMNKDDPLPANPLLYTTVNTTRYEIPAQE